jgi:hypothetical protein
MRRALLLLVAPLLLAGCGGGDQGVESATTAEPTTKASKEPERPKADASATFACRHFRNVISDADVLTDAELREKIKEVEKDANVSQNDGIPEHGRGMLAAITANDVEAFGAEAAAFAQACADLGL